MSYVKVLFLCCCFVSKKIETKEDREYYFIHFDKLYKGDGVKATR